MLSIQKLNDEKKRVNQHLTELGIKKDNQKEIIEAVALTLQPKEFQNEKASVDEQLVLMKREKDEKKLLEYQLKTNPENVSTFLANKFSDGNFNRALSDQYDNTAERIKHGLTFEYHVYLPPDQKFDSKRGLNRYHLSETIIDRKVGDKYVYHVPIHIDSSQDVPFFVTDYGEVVNAGKPGGLLWALKGLRDAIDSGKFQLDPAAEVELSRWGFLVDGRIVHDIKGGVMVEKYLNTLQPEKRVEAIKYLDTSLPKTKPNEKEDYVAPPGNPSKKAKKNNSKETPDDQTPDDQTPDDETPLNFTAHPTVAIKPGDYAQMNVEQVAQINKIPVVEYMQVRDRSDMSAGIKEVIFILTDKKLYKIGLRTGTRSVKISDFVHDQTTYNTSVMQHADKGVLVLRPVPQTVRKLLTDKGFQALFSNEEPSRNVRGFTVAKTL